VIFGAIAIGAIASAPAVLLAQGQVIRFGRLWDGSRVINDAVVVIEAGRIVSVGSSAQNLPQGARVIDLRRYTGLPGLVDVHTHITYYWDGKPGTRPRGQRRHPAVTVFLAQENARRTLESGVTTIRDLNASGDADIAMRDLIAMGKMIGPRMFVSGQGLGARPDAASDPAAMRRLAEERIKAGADWVKVFGSRGGFENMDGTQTVSFEEMQAVVEAAHALGREVAIHSYGPSGVRDAVPPAPIPSSTALTSILRRSHRWQSAVRSGSRRLTTTAITSMPGTSTGSRPARRVR
jgi:imidazolonepropionase-like amidohydrolase